MIIASFKMYMKFYICILYLFLSILYSNVYYVYYIYCMQVMILFFPVTT